MGAASAFDSVADRLAAGLVGLVGVRKGWLARVPHAKESAVEGEGGLSMLGSVVHVELDFGAGVGCVAISLSSCA